VLVLKCPDARLCGKLPRSVLTLAAMGSVAFAPLCAASPASEPLSFTPDLRARFDTAMDATVGAGNDGAPAIVVALVENGAIVYARAAGFSDVASKTAATTATRFRAGSIAKMFTAVAVLQLVESGRIKIDEPLVTYLPNAPHAKEVTIRQLLTHTSGIANYADAALGSGAATKPTTTAGIIDSIASKPLDFVPGRKYGYSNTGYVLLGLAVESVAQQPLAVYERRNILERAAMTQTTFGSVPQGTPAATGYSNATSDLAQPVDATWLYAAGDIVTTAPDLARFDIALMNGKLVAPATFLSMTANGVHPGPDGRAYGFGMTLRPFGDARLIGHHGGLPGFEAIDEMIPTQRFGVVVLGNSFRFSTARIETPVLQSLLPAHYAAFAADERVRASSVAASADPKVTATLRALITGLQHGTLDRSLLSAQMNAAFTADTVATAHAQFAKLGTLKTLLFRGKAVDGNYDVYEYSGTFANDPQLIPLRLVFGATRKIEGFFQQ